LQQEIINLTINTQKVQSFATPPSWILSKVVFHAGLPNLGKIS